VGARRTRQRPTDAPRLGRAAPPATQTAPGRRENGGRSRFPSRCPRQGLAGILKALQRTPEGQRNRCLYWCAKRLAEGAPAHWRQILADAALACGLEPGEIRDTLNSAMGVER
jgi:hypothetical protein